MIGHNLAPRKYHNLGCREKLENRYEWCISQLYHSYGSGYLCLEMMMGMTLSLWMRLTEGFPDLLVTIYLGGREGGSSVEEEGGIPLGQADSQALHGLRLKSILHSVTFTMSYFVNDCF